MNGTPTQDRAPFSAARAAQACADARRVLLNVWDGPYGISYALTLIGIPLDPSMLGNPPKMGDGVDLRAAQIAATNAHHLRDATLYVADPDMCDLIDTAAPSMPDQHLADTDLLTPDGFVWFAEPLPDRTGHDPIIPVAALAWTVVDPDHPLLDTRRDTLTEPTVFLHTYGRLRDMPGFPGPDDPRVANVPGLFPTSSTAWTVGTLIGSAFGEVPPAESRFQPGFYQRLAAAFWTLAQQESLTQATAMNAGDKATRRKAARANVTDPAAPVRVITLRRSRRPATASGGESGRKVGVRFAVEGHWRNQWLPSKKTHRQQWIAPHWRGPEDAPVQGGEKVFLTRGKDHRG